MNVFLPYPDFAKSIACLDNKRQWKQTVEAAQILNVLDKPGAAWYNHPASRMFRDYPEALKLYFNLSLEESIRRGVKVKKYSPLQVNNVVYPLWLGKEKFHSFVRGNLLRKDKEFYSKYGWTDPIREGYWWPV